MFVYPPMIGGASTHPTRTVHAPVAGEGGNLAACAGVACGVEASAMTEMLK